MRPPRILILVLILFLIPPLDGCGRRPRGIPGVMRYPIMQEPSTLDPARIQDIYTNELLQNVYEGLVTFGPDNKIAPQLAERWDLGPDGRTYAFHLRANAHFHAPYDRPVCAQDVKYSLERSLTLKPDSPTALSYLGAIVGARDLHDGKRRDLAGVEVLDALTLTITLDRPRAYFLGALTYPSAWVVCPEAVAKSGGRIDDLSAAIGTGPFRLKEYHHGARVVLIRNDSYYMGRPALSEIRRPIMIDPQTCHTAYLNGELDADTNYAISDYVSDQRNPDLKGQALLEDQANVFYLVMHPKLQPEFADPRVRRAFAMAIDRDQAAALAYKGTAPRADGFLPPGMPGYNAQIHGIPYDPAGARKLLAEAGYPGGQGFPNVTLTYLEKNPEWAATAQVIGDGLKRNLGIQVSYREHEAASFWEDTSNKEKIPFYITGWIADYIDPQDFLSLLLATGSPYNHVGYSSPRFDALCRRADAERNEATRASLYQQADQIALDDVAILPLVYYRQPVLVKPYVRNHRHNLITFFLPQNTTTVQP